MKEGRKDRENLMLVVRAAEMRTRREVIAREARDDYIERGEYRETE